MGQILLLTTLAAAAIPVGAALGRVERLRPNWLERELRHSVIALGGGVLLSAVALVLVPEGIQRLSGAAIAAWTLGGGLVFCAIDVALSRSQTPASQLLAMLADFLPEAMALGALLVGAGEKAQLLALMIALQNLPEGFNAYRELVATEKFRRPHRGRRAQGLSSARVLLAFTLLVPVGPLAGLCGHFWLAEQPALLGGIMMAAAGGILYLTFQDIAPQSRLERHWAPPMGAVLGFLIGVLGHHWIG